MIGESVAAANLVRVEGVEMQFPREMTFRQTPKG